LYGVKPVILGVVLQAIWGLAPKAARSAWLRVLAAVAAGAALAGVNELAVLFGAGALAVVATGFSKSSGASSEPRGLHLVPALPWALGAAGSGAVTLPGLFGLFLKIGSVLFGSGYVLLAFLRADLVQRLGWVTEAQLIDAIAVGQVTPGPVFTTATFIGYVLAGPSGALVATAGIFLPAFVFVALSGPLVPRLRASPAAGAFLDGVNVASLALMTVVTLQLGRAALIDIPTVVLAVVAAVLLVRYRLNATWLVLGGATSGWMVHALGLASV
jgi:chromate transporter